MALQYLFDPNKQFQSLGGVNEVGGFLRVFLNGTDDRATTYKNFDGTLNEADIVLDSYGRAVVIVDDTKTYRIEVYSRIGGLMWTVNNYKARGGSGGSGTPVSVEGTVGEIDVYENTEGGVKHFVVGLATTIKNAITALQLAVNSIGLSLNGKKDKQSPVVVGSIPPNKTVKRISQDANGVMDVETQNIAFPDWTSAINAAVATCENLENKKTTVTGFESSNTYYPTIKAVVDFVNGMLQNLGGKLITDNGDPFTDSSDLPSTTPYGGVDIADKDYAYVQGVGTAERWSATVSGSSVTWLQEYAISIPVFTPSQQAAIDSGVTSAMLGTFLTKTGNGSDVTASFATAGSRTNISTGEKLSVIFGKIAKWFADLKAVAFSGSYTDLSDKPTIPAAANNGILTIKQNGTSKGTFTANQSSDTEINLTDTTYESKNAASGGTSVSLVTTGEKYNWNAKQNAISDLAEIRSGASAGASALQPSGNGSNVTSTFTAASSRTNISSGEKLSVIFGKIAKWFGDLKAVAFSGSYNDLSNKPTIPKVNNGTLTIRQNGTSKGTFTANQSSDVVIDLTNTTYSSLTPEPQDSSAGLCTRGEKFTWGTTGSQLQCARATRTGRYIDIGRLHVRDYGADVEGVAHYTIVGKLSTWANENNSIQFRADVCVEFRRKPNSYPFETSRIYGRILYKGSSSQLSGMSVVTRTEYHIDVATHYDLVIALSIPNASNNYTRIAVESFYAMNDNVGSVDGIKMSYDRDITIYDTEPSGPHIDKNQSYELPTL